MKQEAVRWDVKVSKDTDRTVRRFLGQRRLKHGGLSKFIEEAVQWRMFHQTVQGIKARNANKNPHELQNIIDEAVNEVRAESRIKGKSEKS